VAQVELRTSKVFSEIMSAWLTGRRGILLEGGTSSTKTFSVLQFLHLVAASSKSPLVISITSESLPHLKLGCIRDFFKIIGTSQDSDPAWAKTEYTYHYPNGTVIEFWGTDNEGKARGPRRDILFVNEGNNVPWSTVDSAATRTSRFVIVDWNPTCEFWVHQYGSGSTLVPGWLHDKRFCYNHSTYLDARDVLSAGIIEEIESHKDKDPNWWHIYGEGLLGNIEGLVYPHFEQVDELPRGDKVYGLDFGYTNDPTALVANVIIGDCLYSDELIYMRGLTNDVLARNMDVAGVKQRYDEIIADAAEPKSIEELCLKGFNVKP
jgi:phage terminase large subunit